MITTEHMHQIPRQQRQRKRNNDDDVAVENRYNQIRNTVMVVTRGFVVSAVKEMVVAAVGAVAAVEAVGVAEIELLVFERDLIYFHFYHLLRINTTPNTSMTKFET